MPSLIEVRFTLVATVLPGAQSTSAASAPNLPAGTLTQVQNPVTGEIDQVWETVKTDDPATKDLIEGKYDVFCEVRGIIPAGVKGSADNETWGKTYLSMDVIKMRYPRGIKLTVTDRVFNIRPRIGFPAASIWNDLNTQPTLWDVRGISPILDPFGRQTDSYALLERVQNA